MIGEEDRRRGCWELECVGCLECYCYCVCFYRRGLNLESEVRSVSVLWLSFIFFFVWLFGVWIFFLGRLLKVFVEVIYMVMVLFVFEVWFVKLSRKLFCGVI